MWLQTVRPGWRSKLKAVILPIRFAFFLRMLVLRNNTLSSLSPRQPQEASSGPTTWPRKRPNWTVSLARTTGRTDPPLARRTRARRGSAAPVREAELHGRRRGVARRRAECRSEAGLATQHQPEGQALMSAHRRTTYQSGRSFRSVLAAVLPCLCALWSCKTSCDNADTTATTVTDGIRNSALTVYESAAWDGRYVEFRPQKKLVFEHGLQAIPFNITTYVGFSPCPLAQPGTCSDDPEPSGEVAEAAGDLSPISDVTEQSFTIRNNTCETFYLRVTAEAAEEDGG